MIGTRTKLWAVGTKYGPPAGGESDGLQGDATHLGGSSRFRIDMPDYDCVLKAVQYANFRISHSVPGEVPGPNPIYVKAGWEPDGASVVTALPFQGARTAAILSGGVLRTDPQAIVVPGGSKPFIRQFVNVRVAGHQWPCNRIAHNTTLGESDNVFGTGAGTDQVDVVGAFGNATTTYSFGPALIIGVPADGLRRRACVILDNSLGTVSGVDGTPTYGDANGFAGRAERAIGTTMAVINCSRSTSKLQWQAAGFAGTLALTAPFVTSAVIGLAENDWSTGRTFAQMQADLATLVAGYQAFGVACYALTSSPKVTASANSYLDGGTVLSSGNAERELYNAWLRTATPPLGLVGVFDIAADLEDPARTGFFLANNPALTTDGTHYTQTGMDRAVARINVGLLR